MKSEGAKMPPAPPLEYENTVATSFATHSTSMTCTREVPRERSFNDA